MISRLIGRTVVEQAKFNFFSGCRIDFLSTVSGIRFNGPSDFYKYKRDIGALRRDEDQAAAVKQMQRLHDDLKIYKHKNSLCNVSGQSKELYDISKYPNTPRGLYIHGGVGCGKTMLLNLFYESCDVEKKQIIHCPQFILDVHQRIHDVLEARGPKNSNMNRSPPDNPVALVARDISLETTLLCLDDFQLTEVGDATLLMCLFNNLWQNGVVLFVTSSRKPEDLDKSGVQLFRISSFIDALTAKCASVNINSPDYRRLQALFAERKTYFSATEFDIKLEMDRVYELISGSTGVAATNIEVLGRTLRFERTCGRILDATFLELCAKPLGAADYLELSKYFDVILLRDIPHLSLDKRDETRRFITLIDIFYDRKVKVVFSAQDTLDKLVEADSIATADKENLLLFERTISRMMEMCTAAYWKT